MVKKAKLIFSGSSGCIFTPQIPCINNKKTKKNNKKNKKKITKLNLSENKEYEIGLIIKKISDYKKWTILWEKKCKSPPYKHLKNISEINACLNDFDIDNRYVPRNYMFKIYQSDYMGMNLNDYSKQIINLSTFENVKEFIKIFKKIFKLLNNIFYGLIKLNENKICHHDLNSRNILIRYNKSYIIDYDMSFVYNNIKNNKFLLDRMKEEYENNRIYDPYPYEYLYYILKDKKKIIEEQKNIALYQNRVDYYELYEPIHDQLFNSNTDNLRFELLEDILTNVKKINLIDLIIKLDVYSLGILILVLFIDRSNEHNIKMDYLIKLFQNKELNDIMNLIKDMIAFNNEDRISIHEAYERYKNLI